MITNVYSLYDRKALIYNLPFFAATDGMATRLLTDVVADKNTSVARHPSDYVLYRIGFYDDANAKLSSFEPAVFVCDAIALVAPDSPGDLFRKAAE